MAKEIERKFLVHGSAYRHMADKSIHIMQGYLSADPKATVRVRLAGEKAFLTVKGLTDCAVRDEWEYAIPRKDAEAMLKRCASGRVIDKIRYYVPSGNGLTWEVDEFAGNLKGLVVAEIELPYPDAPFEKPDFIGDEVTGDPAYYNSTLSRS